MNAPSCIASMAQDVLRYTIEAFIYGSSGNNNTSSRRTQEEDSSADQVIVALGSTSRALLHALRQHRRRSPMPLWSALALRTKEATPTSFSFSSPFSGVVGRPSAVYTTCSDTFGLSQLAKLPPSIHTIVFVNELERNSGNQQVTSLVPNTIEYPASITSLVNLAIGSMSAHPLPARLKSIRFLSSNSSFANVDWPDSITTLENVYASPSELPNWSKHLPPQLKRLTFHKNFYSTTPYILFPDALTDLEFTSVLAQSITKLTLPPNLTRLVFKQWPFQPNLGWGQSRHQLSKIAMPNTLRIIDLGTFDQEIYEVVWPQSLTELRFQTFNHPLDRVSFPASLRLLSFVEFNHPLVNVKLPPALELLHLGSRFNQSLVGVVFPPKLHTLTFQCTNVKVHTCTYFNQPLCGVRLPDALTDLRLGDCFSSEIQEKDGTSCLPPFLVRLELGKFNSPLHGNTLSPSLRLIDFGKCFNQSLESIILSPRLQSLRFGAEFQQNLEQVSLPSTITYIDLASQVFDKPLEGVKWPNSLTSLRLSLADTYLHPLLNWMLPPSCTSFYLKAAFHSKSLSFTRLRFPDQLSTVHLHFPPLFYFSSGSSELDHLVLPRSLTRLDLQDFSDSLRGIRWVDASHESLSTPFSLHLGSYFAQSIGDSHLPQSCTELYLGDAWNCHLATDLILPSRLMTLSLGSGFNHPIDSFALPSSLTSLRFGASFSYGIKCRLPSSLRLLHFANPSYQLEHITRLLDTAPPSLHLLTLAGYQTTMRYMPVHRKGKEGQDRDSRFFPLVE